MKLNVYDKGRTLALESFNLTLCKTMDVRRLTHWMSLKNVKYYNVKTLNVTLNIRRESHEQYVERRVIKR